MIASFLTGFAVVVLATWALGAWQILTNVGLVLDADLQPSPGSRRLLAVLVGLPMGVAILISLTSRGSK